MGFRKFLSERKEKQQFTRNERLAMLRGKQQLQREETSALRSEIRVRKQLRSQKAILREAKRERFRDSNVGKVTSIISKRLKKPVTKKTMTRKQGRIMSRSPEPLSPSITLNLSLGGQMRTNVKKRRLVKKPMPDPEFKLFV